jgi:ADP-ribosylglycohydrolase
MFPDDAAAVLRRAACTSGDSDSIACIAGSFVGAYLGAGCWNSDWISRLEYRPEIETLADWLAAA